ncbi:MAG: PepSY domain-containing protein [Gudongella sp.]|jgi:uncharacterized membrane protein YkoI|nr:PepSY domain-containing protein [Gudongella sp.]
MKNITRKLKLFLPILLAVIVISGYLLTQPANSIMMDVNPVIEIVTNRLDRVVKIRALNMNAEEILKGFNPKDKSLEGTISDLVDLLVFTGYLSGDGDNMIKLTVKDDTVDQKLVNRVNRAIVAMLENKQMEARIINGMMIESEPVVAGVKDEEKEVERQLISKEEAEKIALGIVDGRVVEVELDNLKSGKPEYEVEIIKDGVKHEFEIDAYTGRVKEHEIDYSKTVDRQPQKPDQTTTPAKSLIGKDKAQDIALKEVSGGEIIKSKLDNLNEKDEDPEYEITIVKDGVKHELEIDAYTGRIKEHEIDYNYSTGKGTKPSTPTESTTPKEPTVPKEPSVPAEPAKNELIGEKKALEIALGLANGDVIEIELDDLNKKDKNPEYEIVIIKDGVKHEIEIDAYTGRVKEHKQKTPSKDTDKKPVLVIDDMIGIERAKEIALGVKNGKVLSVETEREDGEMAYEVEILFEGQKYEILIHAYSGKVLEVELDD